MMQMPPNEVALFPTCTVESFLPQVGLATGQVLQRCGLRVHLPRERPCCGWHAYTAGNWRDATHTGRACLHALAEYPAVVTPSPTCAHMMRNTLPHLLKEAGEHPPTVAVWDLATFLVEVLGRVDLRARWAARALWVPGQTSRAADHAVRLLTHVRGLDLIVPEGEALHCGGGGTFPLDMPDLALAISQHTLRRASDLGVDAIITGDPECLLWLRGAAHQVGSAIPVYHLADALLRG